MVKQLDLLKARKLPRMLFGQCTISYYILMARQGKALKLTTLFVLQVLRVYISAWQSKWYLPIFIIKRIVYHLLFVLNWNRFLRDYLLILSCHIAKEEWRKIRTSHSTALYGHSVQSEFSVVQIDSNFQCVMRSVHLTQGIKVEDI